MTPTIRIDSEVFAALQEQAQPFVDTPNSVLRRLLGIEGKAVEDPSASAKSESKGPGPIRQKKTAKGKKRTRKSVKKKRTRAPSGSLLPLEDYFSPILVELAARDGEAQAAEIVEAVGQRLRGRLKPKDLEETSSGQTRWKGRVHFAKHRLLEDGYLERTTTKGVWQISKAGFRKARSSAAELEGKAAGR